MPSAEVPGRLGAVVVNFNAGEVLQKCVASLAGEGVEDIIVVDNGSQDRSTAFLSGDRPPARLLSSGRNIGYGAAANVGVSNLTKEFVFVCNPDLVVEPGALRTLLEALDDRPDAAAAGPMLVDERGEVYPSGRRFPGLVDSLGHGFVGLFWPSNPWTRHYRLLGEDQHTARDADWVSGAGFVVRRLAFSSVGGFDESYFMYVEDVDLCWRLHKAGWAVRYEPSARAIHEQGRSTSAHPYRMLLAHHRSILRFARRSTTGAKRLLLPLVALALAARYGLACARVFVAGLRPRAT